MLEKQFTPKDIEKKIYDAWEQNNCFKPNEKKDAFSIVLPPPNVTGNLHMGHALNNTMQDIIARYNRIKGKSVLWLPGTDHAGIATQMVVERLLEKDGVSRHTLGRDSFLDKVWDWKAESGGQIVHQQRRLGNSTDWSRERFTMDKGLCDAVQKVFVQLYDDGLIYKDKRLVNWDVKLETAISDLEVIQTEVDGHMWFFKYPIVGLENTFITVGTTRPETMLGDTGIAVNPDDENYKALVGKKCIQPLTGRHIPIVADSYADPEQGTGAVKITPAHDFNDFEVGKRQSLDSINILNRNGTMNENCPEKYQGMDRFVCRDAVVSDMADMGYHVKTQDYAHAVPFGDRSGTTIEPYLTDQWYVDAPTLAKPAIESVEQGRTKFVPENWTKTYFDWMYNIQPWCISRQLWWGHQIPAWYAPDGSVFVAETEQQAYEKAQQKLGADVILTRDEDVLDTWFSSALWPFSTLGWPEKTADLEKFYQTDVLVTGFDIIFFWVARMMMMGLHFMKKEPFHTVVVHALVLDEHGAKMSKSKGNVIDPLNLIDKYGADATRFTLTSLATPGKDIKFSVSRIEGNRNFMTKIWNVAKFCEMNTAYAPEKFDSDSINHPVNQWIIANLEKAQKDIDAAMTSYRFSEVANILYHFVRGTFCDWYVELSKPLFWSDNKDLVSETQDTAGWVFKQILRLMHPVVPFISEELWKDFGTKNELLIDSTAESFVVSEKQTNAQKEIDWVIRLITAIRSTRAEMNVPAGNTIPIHIKDASESEVSYITNNMDMLKRLTKVEEVIFTDTEKEQSGQFLLDSVTVYIPFAGAVNIEDEINRLNKVLKKAQGDYKKFNGKLSSEGYLKQAPEHIIEKDKNSMLEAQEIIEKTTTALDGLHAL